MGKAAIATLIAAVVLFVAMGWVQKELELCDFRFGSKWSFSAKTLQDAIDKDLTKPPLVIVPVLFPLDFLLLISIGATLTLCSVAYADALVTPSRTWLLLVLPLAYMVADFSENMLYSGMLLRPSSIQYLIEAGNWATRVKIVTLGLATLQAAAALLLSRLH
jgi:hypothetical protein